MAGVQGFLQFIYRRLNKGSIKLEQESHPLMAVALYGWFQDLLSALGAVDIARMKQAVIASIPAMVQLTNEFPRRLLIKLLWSGKLKNISEHSSTNIC